MQIDIYEGIVESINSISEVDFVVKFYRSE